MYQPVSYTHLDVYKRQIVCRNVIWVLDEPEKVYREFYQILKPGGKLLVYDANWNMPFFDKEMQSRVKQHELDYYNETGIQFKDVYKRQALR